MAGTPGDHAAPVLQVGSGWEGRAWGAWSPEPGHSIGVAVTVAASASPGGAPQLLGGGERAPRPCGVGSHVRAEVQCVLWVSMSQANPATGLPEHPPQRGGSPDLCNYTASRARDIAVPDDATISPPRLPGVVAEPPVAGERLCEHGV